jgi:uncharacterized delta-60 repeat protein
MTLKKPIKLVFLITPLIFMSSFIFLNSNLFNFQDIELKSHELHTSDIKNHVFEWYRIWEGKGEWNYGIAIDSFDYIYTVGSVWNIEIENYDIALVKFNNSGDVEWERIILSSSQDLGQDIAIDSSNNIYIVGDTGPYGDIIILKYNNSGTQLWNTTWDLGYSDHNYGYGIKVDKFDDIYVGGYSVISGERSEIVLIKYNKSGTQLWNTTWGGQDWDFGYGVSTDSSGNAYVVGATSSYGVGRDIIIIKFNSSGSKLWNVTWVGPNYDYGNDIVLDSNDNIYIVGTTGIGSSDNDIVIAKYSSSGSLIWNKTWGGGGNDEGYGISLDSFNNIYITGIIEVDNMRPIALIKYNNSGTQLWNKTWSGFNYLCGQGVAIDSSNMVYIVGNVQNPNMQLILFKYAIDSDGDDLSDNEELYIYFTDPNNPDSDADGLDDWEEIKLYSTNPNDSDSDDDGLDDWEEINLYSTDPNDSDTDNDGFSDGEEIANGFDPNDYYSNPNIAREEKMIRELITIVLIISIPLIISISLIYVKRKSTKHKREKLIYDEIPDLEILVKEYIFSEIEGIRNDFRNIHSKDIDGKIKNKLYSNINKLVEILKSKEYSFTQYQVELLKIDCYSQSKPLRDDLLVLIEDHLEKVKIEKKEAIIQEKIKISKELFGSEIKDTKDIEELERYKSLDEKIDNLLEEFIIWKKD